ncbi:hypothetical protein BDZ88DRAFT_404010 [Geranomyces variabilis]|nr:hypothetical protein BDZ88DRAFT_404010 [Geranomyces variabilis]
MMRMGGKKRYGSGFYRKFRTRGYLCCSRFQRRQSWSCASTAHIFFFLACISSSRCLAVITWSRDVDADTASFGACLFLSRAVPLAAPLNRCHCLSALRSRHSPAVKQSDRPTWTLTPPAFFFCRTQSSSLLACGAGRWIFFSRAGQSSPTLMTPPFISPLSLSPKHEVCSGLERKKA